MIRDGAAGPIEDVEFRGAAAAAPTAEVLAAIAGAAAVIVGPSNPVISIGPILALPGMRDALRACPGPVVAVSPLVGGRSLKGPTEAFLAWAGEPLTQRRDRGVLRRAARRARGRRARRRAADARDRRRDARRGRPPARGATRRCGSRSRSADSLRRRCAPPPSCRSSRSGAPSSASTPRSQQPDAGGPRRRRWSATCSRRWARVRGLDDLIVVTAEPRAAAAARAAGAHVVHDPAETGQSDAAARGIAAAVARGAGRDAARARRLPVARPGRGRGAARDGDHDGAGVVIVPDRHGTGTNALLLTPPDVIAPAFGPGSFARHAARAARGRRDRARRARPVAGARRRHAGRPRRAARGARAAARTPRRAPARCCERMAAAA